MELYLVEMDTRGVENEKLYVVAESFNKARELAESEHITWEVVSIEIIANKNMSNLIIDLKQQLAEKDKQLQNAVFPKFKVGDEVWFLYSTIYYLNKNKKDKICKGKITRVISYEIDNRDNLNVDNIFTKAEAEEALKKLEE